MHRVEPTPAELQLIAAIAGPIQKLNRLAQISILQALTSSPDALSSQLTNMARNGTVPSDLAQVVREIVRAMPLSGKLQGLAALIDRLVGEDPARWRLVIFTGRLETQTTIQAFLESRGLRVGIINGTSGLRNQDTIARFRSDPPKCHVIVSTEAGSEGVNLQVANVLVNYDLPWNPMIVEQRIGRVQRLASKHASVGIFNVMLRGTFEEYIVGRLMEKLQMAAHAIGDIESLLEASGVGRDGESEGAFDERIRELVVAALAGKDVEAATRQTEQSIAEAKSTLEREEQNINAMLGAMEGVDYVGPRAPVLPSVNRSMGAREFSLAALELLGGRVTAVGDDVHLVEREGAAEHIRFTEQAVTGVQSILYAPGAPAFLRLVSQITATGVHRVTDRDHSPGRDALDVARRWVESFGGAFTTGAVGTVRRCFDGTALILARATVAHDSYERLVAIDCSPSDHCGAPNRSGLEPLTRTIDDAAALGLNLAMVAEAAHRDEGISEFCRFYSERRAQETEAAGDDYQKRTKLEDEFTPRVNLVLVGLEGSLHRVIEVKTRYHVGSESEYESIIMAVPHLESVQDPPAIATCDKSLRTAPTSCLDHCAITGARVLRHVLLASEVSSRLAVPEATVMCAVSNKRVLLDEAEVSAVTGRRVALNYLKTSAMSGRRAEQEYFGVCEFSSTEVLTSELSVSEHSGRRYRVDEQARSAVSGRAGHRHEFVTCSETGKTVAAAEADQCEVTGRHVCRGLLDLCAVTGKRVVSSELIRCAVSGKRALKQLLVVSSVSGAAMLEDLAVRSTSGAFCGPLEAKTCAWSLETCHPDDLRRCALTGLAIHVRFANTNEHPSLHHLVELLDGVRRTGDKADVWERVAAEVAEALGKGRCRIEAATLSPDAHHLAASVEVRTMLGLRVRHVGVIYSLDTAALLGRIALGRRGRAGWVEGAG